METRLKKDFLINTAYLATLAIIGFIVIKFLMAYCLPFISAFLIAFCVQRPAEKLNAKISIKKSILAGLLSSAVFIVAVGIFCLVLTLLINNSDSLLSSFGKLFSDLSDMTFYLREKIASTIGKNHPEIRSVIDDMTVGFSRNITDKFTAFLSGFAGNLIKKIPDFLFNFIIALVATFYIAKDFDILKRFYRNLFGRSVYQRTIKIKEILKSNVFKMLKGYFILLGITFAELLLGFVIIGIDNVIFVSLAVAVVDLLPVFGTGTVLIPWGVLELIFGNSVGIAILILYVIITVIRNFLEPKIIGNQIGINPLFTLISIFLGLKIAGFWGLLLFPIALIVIIKYYKQEN